MSDSGSNEDGGELTEEQQEEQLAQLNQKIIEVFMKYDEKREDFMAAKDFKQAMDDMGDSVNEKMLNFMLMTADPNNSGQISFDAFKSLIIKKRESERGSTDAELLDAFVAMGGEEDGEGSIDAAKLIQVIKHDFQMTIDIEALI